MITLRKVNLIDIMFLYRLRNDPFTYKYFKNNHPVNLISHLIYFIQNYNNRNIILLRGKPIGQVKINNKEISLSILKEFCGFGYGKKVVNMFDQELISVIHKDNKASLALFESCDFRPIKKDDTYVTMTNRWGGFYVD